MTFGSKLKKMRKERGLTQDQLARELGLSKTSLVRYELDKREPNFEAIKKIENYFNVSIDEIINDLKETRYILNGREKFENVLSFVGQKQLESKLSNMEKKKKNEVYILLANYYSLIGNLETEDIDLLYMLYVIGEELKKLPYIKTSFFNEVDLNAPASEGDVLLKAKSKITTEDFEKALTHINQIKSTISKMLDKYIVEYTETRDILVFQKEIENLTISYPADKELYDLFLISADTQ